MLGLTFQTILERRNVTIAEVLTMHFLFHVPHATYIFLCEAMMTKLSGIPWHVEVNTAHPNELHSRIDLFYCPLFPVSIAVGKYGDQYGTNWHGAYRK